MYSLGGGEAGGGAEEELKEIRGLQWPDGAFYWKRPMFA